MKIGIFGGAFNPPHKGHVNAAKTACLEQKLDRLIVIPTGTSPHKPMPTGTPKPEQRLQMTKNAFSAIHPGVIISEIEIYSEENNYTIDTINIIKKKYPDDELFLLVGNDMYDSLNAWKDSKILLNMVTPVLLPRDLIKITSTELRELLPNRKGYDYICDENYAFIIKHRLYNAKPNWDWLRGKAREMLEPKRIPHVEGCELSAMQLAKRWGENVDDAREAAILHDITKKLDFDDNMCIIAESGLVTNSYNISEAKLLHSVTAAIIAKSDFGVSDKVAEAIRLHTTGAANMTLLDKIIYLADYIEPTRDIPNIDELRKSAFEDIDKAMIMGLQMAIDDLTARDIAINKSTLEAINDLKRLL